MANKLLIRRSATPLNVPTTGQLDLGELAINTYDGKLFLKKDSGTPEVVEIGGGIKNVVEDTTPQLGGALDLNGFDITSTNFNWDESAERLSIGDPDSGLGRIRRTQATSGLSGTLLLEGAIANADQDGGKIQLQAGGGNGTGSGGEVLIRGGLHGTTGSGGQIRLLPEIDYLDNGGTVILDSPTGATTSSVFEFGEAATNGENGISLKAPDSVTTNRTWVLPDDDPSTASGQFLTTDSSGNLSFGTPTGTGLQDVVDDTTPQLGGNLDVNGNIITSAPAATDSDGGPLAITAAAGDLGGDGGTLTITSGAGGSEAAGGALTVQGGAGGSTEGDGAPLYLYGGAATTDGFGGEVELIAGNGVSTGDGGGVTISSGSGVSAGNIRLQIAGATKFTVEADGTLSVPIGTYETLVTADDDIPNKKYVDDAITAGGLQNVVEDTTPQLGGNLDVNNFSVVGKPAATATSAGGSVNVTAATGGATSGNGGAINLTAGSSTAGGGGAYLILDGGGATSGGYVELGAGSSNGAGVNIEMAAGNGDSGGDFRILTGRGSGSGLAGGDFSVELGKPGVTGTPGKMILKNNGTMPAGWAPEVLFQNDDGGAVELTIPTGAYTTRTWTLPDDDPSTASGKYLTTDASGNLSFDTPTGTGLQDVVDDTTPQLGGDLDIQARRIYSSGTTMNILYPSVQTSGTAGQIKIEAQDHSGAGGFGGNVTIEAGSNTTDGSAGTLQINGGDGTTFGGDVQINGGNAVAGSSSGGNVLLAAGYNSNTGFGPGYVMIYSNDGNVSVPLRMREARDNGTNYVQIRAPHSVATSRTWYLPDDDPSTASGKYLTTDASGNLSFDAPSGGLANVVEDTTPQLGGTLDVNDFDIKAKDAADSSSGGNDVTIYATDSGSSGLAPGGDLFLKAGGIGTFVDGAVINMLGALHNGKASSIEILAGDPQASSGYAGGDITIAAGGGEVTGGTSGGEVYIKAGQGGSTGTGGDIVLTLRAGGTGSAGTMILETDDTGAVNEPRFRINSKTGTGGITLTVPNMDTLYRTWVLMDDDPASVDGQYIKTDSSGNLSFGTPTGSGLQNVVEDTSPELGANLDVNGFDIVSTTAGTPVELRTANTALSGAAIKLLPGDGSGIYSGGSINLSSGNALGTGTGGHLYLYAGDSAGQGGNVDVRYGNDTTDGNSPGHFTIGVGKVTSTELFKLDETGIRIREASTAPTTDTTSYGYVYIDPTSNNLTFRDEAGTVTDLTAGGIADVVDDTTPQLGGHLDVNGKQIQNGSTTITLSSTGTSTFYGAGGITIQALNGEDTRVTAGTDSGSQVGTLFLNGGYSNANDGGPVAINGGNAPGGIGGDIEIQPGYGSTASSGGSVKIFNGFTGQDTVIVKFQESAGNGTDYIGLRAPAAITTSRTWVLPDDDPSTASGQFLTTDASGNLSFAAAASDVVDDTTPQLGGNLDVNGKSIVSLSNADVVIVPNGTGVISVAGTTNYETNVTADDDVPNKKYVDDSVASSTGVVAAEQFHYTASASQTTFSGADTNGNTLAYAVGDVFVYINGSLQDPADYTATNGTSVVLDTAAELNDIVMIVASASTNNVATLSDVFRKNLLINGNFHIWQRGVSFTIPSAEYTADRWQASEATTGAVTVTRETETGAYPFRRYWQLNVTTADTSIGTTEYAGVGQWIEGKYIEHLSIGKSTAKTVTLSFWHKHTVTGTYSISLRNSAIDRSYTAEYTQTTTDTWEQASITIDLDTSGTWLIDNGIGLRVWFACAVGSTYTTTAGSWSAGNYLASSNQVNGLATISNKFRIANVQLELGSVATDFEAISEQETMDQCERYYERSYSSGTLGVGAVTNIGMSYTYILLTSAVCSRGGRSQSFRAHKRAVPTVTIYSPSTGTAGKAYSFATTADVTTTTASPGTTGFYWYTNAFTTSTAASVGCHWVADAEL